MLKIRLRRMGAKKSPFYRIVVADSRAPRDGAFVEEIGYYNPTTEPAEIKVDAEKAQQWIKDGVMYMEAEGQKIKMPMDFSDMLAAVQQQTSSVTLANDGLYQIDSITAAESDEGTTYTIVLNGAVNRLLTQMLGQMGDFGEAGLDGMKLDAVSMSVLIDKEGTLKTIGMQFAMTMDMTVEGEATSIAYEYDMDCTINALGDDVVITFPDFTGFEELTQPQPEIGDGETVSDETLDNEAAAA